MGGVLDRDSPAGRPTLYRAEPILAFRDDENIYKSKIHRNDEITDHPRIYRRSDPDQYERLSAYRSGKEGLLYQVEDFLRYKMGGKLNKSRYEGVSD
jgi:hypothetical protein